MEDDIEQREFEDHCDELAEGQCPDLEELEEEAWGP